MASCCSPTDTFDIRLIGDYTEHNEELPCDNHAQDPDLGADGCLCRRPGRGVIPVADPSPPGLRQLSTQQKIVDEGVSSEINWNTPWFNNVTLTSFSVANDTGARAIFNQANDLAIHDFSSANGQRFNTSQELIC